MKLFVVAIALVLPWVGLAKRKDLQIRFGMSDRVRDMIVQQHNNFRRLVANGRVKGQPAAANMKLIKWNKDLEIVSRLWADQCTFEHRSNSYNQPTNACGAAGYDWVSENLFVKSMHVKKREGRVAEVIKTIRHANDVWFDEHRHFTFPNSCAAGEQCGHYTQIVWADTEQIGCAISLCKSIDQFRYRNTSYNVVCSYGPGGNIDGKQPYRVGRAGKRCPADRPANFKGLCGGSGEVQCRDKNTTRNCDYWKGQGHCRMCQSTYSFMKDNCYKSCGMCSDSKQQINNQIWNFKVTAQ